jgi:hypothetical protein
MNSKLASHPRASTFYFEKPKRYNLTAAHKLCFIQVKPSSELHPSLGLIAESYLTADYPHLGFKHHAGMFLALAQ